MEANDRFSKFVPDRLIEAREARGLTITELAEMINISHQAISKYEKKKAVPSYDTLEKLSMVLKLPTTYFYKMLEPRKELVVFFRSKSFATVKSKKVHENKIYWIQDIFEYLQTFLDFPVVNVPRYITRETYIPTDFEKIDQMASDVRKMWGLGNGPISNVVLLLEKMGIIIGRSPFSNYSIDACSRWETGKHPFILLSDDKTAARSRFDVAHELAHLVLHSSIKPSEFNKKENYKLIEKEAHRFAGAFLLPASSFGPEIVSSEIEHFIALKKRWKVSIQAMTYRATKLGILSDYQHIYIRQRLAKNNQLTKEPLDDVLIFEEPSALKQAILALVEHKIKTKQDIVNELSFSHEEIEEFSNLDKNYLFPFETNNIIQFKLK